MSADGGGSPAKPCTSSGHDFDDEAPKLCPVLLCTRRAVAGYFVPGVIPLRSAGARRRLWLPLAKGVHYRSSPQHCASSSASCPLLLGPLCSIPDGVSPAHLSRVRGSYFVLCRLEALKPVAEASMKHTCTHAHIHTYMALPHRCNRAAAGMVVTICTHETYIHTCIHPYIHGPAASLQSCGGRDGGDDMHP